ncbi:hypothetical protein G7Y89_g1472 [Cudoniella acicularis]|uniref:Oxidative stress survival, Svf1-like protein n=1 Tax=Cudoniella acicularis TaxID=354080 RepID=A0A8H4RX64_9HELO|nr:hypothetical protein G7Y89_g1472 [Cudoniella acicularis]
MAGKPIHPATVHFPITFITLAGLLDLLHGAAESPITSSFVASAVKTIGLDFPLSVVPVLSFYATILALITIVPAILSGGSQLLPLIQRDGFGTAKARAALAHALLNDVATAMLGYNFWTRRTVVNYVPNTTNIALSGALALPLVLFAASLGGELVYTYGGGGWEGRHKIIEVPFPSTTHDNTTSQHNPKRLPANSFKMMNWAKQQMANVVGTQEPIYGPSAIQSVALQTETTPYTELTRDDMKWVNMDTTSVETQTFHLTAASGHLGLAQVIYSNVAGLRTTVQFNSKIFYPKSESKPNMWSSSQLSDVEFNEEKTNFYAENCAIELSEDGKTYKIKSATNPKAIVNLTVTRTSPGFVVGKNGTTYYGTDPKAPWGSMRHAFWPRNTVEGSIITEDGPVDFKGTAVFVHALQGMKPHHAAAKWKFIDFEGPTYSAIMMEFITPKSYGSTAVNVGGITKDGEILIAGSSNSALHTKIKGDPENDWPVPEAIKGEWKGKTKDGKDVDAVLESPLGERLDKIDVMAEVPGFVKSIVAAAAGTKPYIYQFSPDAPVSLKLKIGDEEITEEGSLFTEAVFLCE